MTSEEGLSFDAELIQPFMHTDAARTWSERASKHSRALLLVTGVPTATAPRGVAVLPHIDLSHRFLRFYPQHFYG